MKDNRWTIRSTEWQIIEGVRSVGRPNLVGEMTLCGNKEQHGQGQQKTEKVVGLRWRATSCSGRTQPRQGEAGNDLTRPLEPVQNFMYWHGLKLKERTDLDSMLNTKPTPPERSAQ